MACSWTMLGGPPKLPKEVAADSPGASVAADLAAGEHGGPRQAAFAMAKKAGTTLQLCFRTNLASTVLVVA